MKKRGLSPVIGAVLLIMLVCAVGTMIFGWARHTVRVSEQEALEEKFCRDANFVIGDFCYDETTVYVVDDSGNVVPETVGVGDNRKQFWFNARNDARDVDLEGFIIKVNYGSRTISLPTLAGHEMESASTDQVRVEVLEDVDDIQEIEVLPKMRMNNRIVLCENEVEVVSGGEIGPCP